MRVAVEPCMTGGWWSRCRCVVRGCSWSSFACHDGHSSLHALSSRGGLRLGRRVS